MMWQDYVMTGASILFNYALIPQVYYGFKNKAKTVTRQTGAITFVGVSALIYTEASLGLVMSPITTTISAALWGALTYQAFAYEDISDIRRESQKKSELEDIIS